MDTLTPKQRSERMSRIRSKNSMAERFVRKLVHSMGYRYRLHQKHLPGNPDLVFPKRRKIIFVHGCFWHRHDDSSCKLARLPKSRLDFWLPKLEGNRRRDEKNLLELVKNGWSTMTVWECQIGAKTEISKKIKSFLDANSPSVVKRH